MLKLKKKSLKVKISQQPKERTKEKEEMVVERRKNKIVILY